MLTRRTLMAGAALTAGAAAAGAQEKYPSYPVKVIVPFGPGGLADVTIRAVADKATVPMYYESRIAKLSLNQAVLPTLDDEFDEITEGEELTKKEQLKSKWAALEALVGDPKRIALIASDLVAHYERRLEALDGKAMIVCMSRRICVELYKAILKLRPDWAGAKDDDEACRDMPQEEDDGAAAKEPEDRSQKPERPCEGRRREGRGPRAHDR